MEIGKYLKEKRVAKGLSQGDVAKKLGYTTSQFISNWERGESNPPLNTLRKIAEVYEISPDELFDFVLKATIAEVTEDLNKKFYGRNKVK